jgi:hypothetical protein
MPPQRTVRGFGLIDQLKDRKSSVSKLLAYVEDEDEPKAVEVPDVRNRWQKVMRVLDELRWTKVEMVNRKGEIVYVHNRGPDDERPAGELEDIALPTGGGIPGQMSQVLGVAVHWVLKAQEVALVRHQASVETVLDAQNKLVDSTIKRFEEMDKQNAQLLRLNHALNGELVAQQLAAIKRAAAAAGQVEGAGGESPLSDAVVEQLLPALMKKVLDDPPPAKSPPNGANGKRAG